MHPPVLVLGSGVIGCSVAYHLTLLGASVTILESTAPACAASGKAGGFLARDWYDGGTTERLSQIAFEMHERLARELHIESFRRLPTYRVGSRCESTGGLEWVLREHSLLDKETAQVSPAELSAALLNKALEQGATLRIAEVVGMLTEAEEEEERPGARCMKGVQLASGEVIPASQVVVAMGPWSCRVEDWLGIPVPMEGVWSTSLLYEGAAQGLESPAALFCDEDRRGCNLEVYPRPNGDVYVCGLGGSEIVNAEVLRAGELPPSQANRPDPKRVAAAEVSLREIAQLDAEQSHRQQACLRPCPPDGLPIMGALPGVRGAYIAAGHNCWGISWAPVTGLAMAQLVLDGAASVISLAPYSPRRFDTSTYRALLKQRLRGRRRKSTPMGEQW